MSTVLYFVAGDNKQLRSWIVRNGPLPTSPPIDLSAATAVEIHVPGIPSGTPAGTLPCTFVADATGTVSRTFAAADLVKAGLFGFETQITFADGTVATVPDPGADQIKIRSALG